MNDLAALYAAPFIIGVAGLTTLAATQLLARIVVAVGFLPDAPNGRSSHTAITPRSGGLAIIGAWLAGLAVFAIFSSTPGMVRRALEFAPLVCFIFIVGVIDDRYNLRAFWKFAGQLVAAILFVIAFGPLQYAPLPFAGDASLGAFAAPITVFWIVGFINAYNFMDGVNGIAAACAALALSALAVATAFAGAPFWAVVTGLGAAALVAFLPLNFVSGRLFMGDNGSQAVGFVIAAVAVVAANETNGAVSPLFAPMVMLPFIFDVSFTLVHRALRRQDILSAHREHLYQLLARSGQSHVSVTAIYLCLTALTTVGAILMLRLTPDRQWMAPAAFIVLLSVPAVALFRDARARGLLAGDADFIDDMIEDDEMLDSVETIVHEFDAVRPHAAE